MVWKPGGKLEQFFLRNSDQFVGVRGLQNCPLDFQRKFRVHSPIYSSYNQI